MMLAEDICFFLARKMLARTAASKTEAERGREKDVQAYAAWRASELYREFTENFDASVLKDKDVLDFGCGEGELSFVVANMGVETVTGVDLSEKLIAAARAQAEMRALAVKPAFIYASDSKTIDLGDDSVDVIMCFDVLEHIIEYGSVIREWQRILRPGGRVLICWQPWFHPYGHHISRYIPIPWAHAIFPEKVLIRTCARIYDLPEYEPQFGEVDAGGAKRPNPWYQIERLDELNRLTISQFERVCDSAGLRVAVRRFNGIRRGTPLGVLTQALTLVPRVRDFFCSNVIYELCK